MAERNLAQHLPDGDVGVGVRAVLGKPVPVERPGQLEHPRPHGAEVRLRRCQHLIRRALGPQHQAELLPVVVRPQAPGVLGGGLQIRFEPAGEGAQGLQSRGGRAIVGGAQRAGNGGANGVVDQLDVAGVLVEGDLGPDGRRILQVAPGGSQERGQLLEARDDVPHPHRRGRVLQDVGREHRVPGGFDVQGRVVPVALDVVQLQERQLDLVEHDAVVHPRPPMLPNSASQAAPGSRGRSGAAPRALPG